MSAALPVVRWLARTACWLFYRVDQAGSPPQTGPLLFVANHANALLDPAIVWATAGRDVRFLAKSTLFDGPLKPFLAGAGAIPVYRRRDEGVDMSTNAEMFSAVDAALARRGCGVHFSRRDEPLAGPARRAADGRGANRAGRRGGGHALSRSSPWD